MNFGVCDFSRFAVTDWRVRRWRLWFLALMTATHVKAMRVAHYLQGNSSFHVYLQTYITYF